MGTHASQQSSGGGGGGGQASFGPHIGWSYAIGPQVHCSTVPSGHTESGTHSSLQAPLQLSSQIVSRCVPGWHSTGTGGSSGTAVSESEPPQPLPLAPVRTKTAATATRP